MLDLGYHNLPEDHHYSLIEDTKYYPLTMLAFIGHVRTVADPIAQLASVDACAGRVAWICALRTTG